jgi:protein SCO1
MPRPRAPVIAGVVLLVGLATGAAIALSQGPAPAPLAAPPGSPAWTGWPFHRLVPNETLTTADGGTLSLASLHGRVVVLAPSMTLCHEVCPLTTQALMNVRRTLARAGRASRVAIVEATVDPWRDSPSRLRAYDRLTGARLLQLTGTVRQMRRLWNFFGIGFRRVRQGTPADLDWLTNRPETFDVEHADGVFLIDARGYERVFYPGYADVGGRLAPALRRLLSSTGLGNLARPQNAWTAPQLLAGIDRLLRS